MIGKTIGSHEIVARLGAGGMGEVYRARDTRLDRDVAIKILPESFAGDPDRLMGTSGKRTTCLNAAQWGGRTHLADLVVSRTCAHDRHWRPRSTDTS